MRNTNMAMILAQSGKRFAYPQNVSGGGGGGGSPLSVVDPTGSVIVANGTITSVSDPNGSGQSVYRREILNSSYPSNKEVRAEHYFDSGQTAGTLTKAVTFTWAFGVLMDPTYNIITPAGGDDGMLVMQTHASAQGDTQPPIALFYRGQANDMRWRRSYNTYPAQNWEYNNPGSGIPDTEGVVTLSTQTMPSVGTWYFFVVVFKPSWIAGDSPFTRIYQSINGAAYTQIVNDTGLNDYNPGNTGYGPQYLRSGLYKWSSSLWSSNRIVFYSTPMYYGVGDLVAEGKTSLVPYGGATS